MHQKRSFEDIIREDSKVQIERLQGHQIIRSMNGNVGFQPLVEGRHDNRSVPGFLDDEPRYVIGNGTFKKVPLLTGVTLHETANAINVKNIEKAFTNATKFLGSLANSVKKNGLMKTVAGTLLPGLGEGDAFLVNSRLKTFFFLKNISISLIFIQKKTFRKGIIFNRLPKSTKKSKSYANNEQTH